MSASDASEYFSELAGLYADHRPGYPRAAIDAALDDLPAPARVLDVGCGTGIATRRLAEGGAHVVGLDPNRGMLDEAERHPAPATGTVRYVCGSAEDLPVEDGAVDLVFCAQSFHWFDAASALAEFRRVLTPAGRLVLVWNVRTTDDTLSAAYEAIVERAQADAAARGMVVHRIRSHRPDGTGHFENVRGLSFDNPQRLDWAGLLGRIRSASYFPREGGLREALEAELRSHFVAHARDGVATLAQRTEVTLADACASADPP